jgi:hypothetical protein
MIKVQANEYTKEKFLEIIQKRARKELRIGKLINKNDKILIIDNGSAESKVSVYLLKAIIKDLPVEITIKKLDYELGENVKGEYNKIIIPWNADFEGEYFLKCIFEKLDMDFLGHFNFKNKTYVKLLLPCLAKEVSIFADIKKYKYEIITNKTYISNMLDTLESEYPEIKFSLLKSSKEIKKIN